MRAVAEMMQPKRHYQFIGRGAYSLAEAARLTGVASASIRRWTQGYTFRYQDQVRESAPIIASNTPRVDGVPTLDFADLLEIRFLNAFRGHGVSLGAIRVASVRAQELLGRPRPFSTRIFKTDGHTILAELVRDNEDPMLLDLVRNQFEFKRILDPYLYVGIEFNQLDEPRRWWPLGADRHVVIDPARALGAPIVTPGGVPTAVLAASVRGGESHEAVAAWYQVPLECVDDAVVFEDRLVS